MSHLKPTLKYSIRDGFAWSLMSGFGETYISAFGVFLKAIPLQIGILAALPQVVGALSQPLGVRVMEKWRVRRTWIAWTALFQALIWIPIAFLPLLFGQGPLSVTALMGLLCVYFICAGSAVPAWNSLMGDVVPAEMRGRYFGLRSRICSIPMFASLVVAGQVLHIFERAENTAGGFLLIFLVACGARLVSAYWLSRHDDPPYDPRRSDYFSFYDFLRRAPHSNFAKFVFFVGFMNFALNVAGPYFAVYMLRELAMPYMQYTAVIASSIAIQFLTLQHWGGLADRFGNKRILNVCAIGVGIVPILWAFSPNIWYLIVVQLTSGFVWAGFNLATGNFLFDAVSPAKRARCVAYQSVVNAAFVLTGSLIGGFIASHPPGFITSRSIPFLSGSIYVWLFVLSGLLRLISAAVFLPRFREVRDVEAIRHHDLIFRIAHLRPMSGASFTPLVGRFRTLDRLRRLYSLPRASRPPSPKAQTDRTLSKTPQER